MSKLENYNGSVELMAGITQKGGGDFALIDANAVQVEEDGTRLDAKLETLSNDKVDKVTGKGLSTNDYTTTEKNKLSGIEANANKTIVDTTLSDSSLNPIQNKVVKEALDELTTQIDEVASTAQTKTVITITRW